MSLIQVTNLTFAYEGNYDAIFENLTLQLDTNWKLGFVGRNGRGKTTFLKLLLGELPYQGKISASVDFEYFPLALADPNQNTQTIIQSIAPDCQLWELEKELSLLSVEEAALERPFATLSGGEQTKVMLAALFLKPNRFLLIDEPTNHLDVLGRELVSAYLTSKTGFILVSHDRIFLDKAVDHVLAINKAGIQVEKGNFSTWLENKTHQDNFELGQNQRLQKDIKKLTTAAKRTKKWSNQVEKTKFGTKNSGIKPDKGFIGHKSAKMMARSKLLESRQEKALEEKSTLLKNLEAAEDLKLRPLPYFKGTLLEANGLWLAYESNMVCSNINFSLNQGDRLAITGKNGSGKSSLLKLLLGQPLEYGGHLYMGSRLQLSYIPQDTSYLKGSITEFAKTNQIEETLLRTILRKLDFSRLQFEKNLEDYSGGQKKKVLLACSLCQPAHLYVWDEPLNFIDVISRMQIEELLLKYKPTMIFVEHDLAFINAIATKRLEL